MYNIGRPQDYFDVFVGKLYFNYDYLIIGCHGDGGKIIVPILGENVYYPNECRNNIGYEELQGSVKIKDKTVICTTGAGDLCKAFNRNNNILLLLRVILKATAVCCLLWTCFIICPTDRVLKTALPVQTVSIMKPNCITFILDIFIIRMVNSDLLQAAACHPNS